MRDCVIRSFPSTGEARRAACTAGLARVEGGAHLRDQQGGAGRGAAEEPPAGDRQAGAEEERRRCVGRRDAAQSEKDAKLAQKLNLSQLFLAVFPQRCMGQLASFGPT